MKQILSVLALLLCLFVFTSTSPAASRGFVKKASSATFALYASSERAGIQDRFICTATAISKVDGGYELLSAGHCTPANPDLPTDMTFSVATDLGGKLIPVPLVASVMNEPNDWAVFYMPTQNKYPVMKLDDVNNIKVGDKTVDVNFSLGVAKEVSEGEVSSTPINDSSATAPDAIGDFEVSMFGSNGASGSSVIDMNRGKKIIGIVIFGFHGETMPMLVEPISNIYPQIKNLKMTDMAHFAAREQASPDPVAAGSDSCNSVMQKVRGFLRAPLADFEKVYGEPFSIASGYADGTVRNAYNFHFDNGNEYVQFDVVTKDGTIVDIWEDACGSGGRNIIAPTLPPSQEFFMQRGQRGRRGGTNRGQEHRQQPPRQEPPRERPTPPREQRPDRNPRDHHDRGNEQHRRPRYDGENHTHRYHRDHDRDVRYYPDGRQGICYGGVWFAAIYPEWVWTDEVYFVEIAPGEWVVVDYDNPAFSASVDIVY